MEAFRVSTECARINAACKGGEVGSKEKKNGSEPVSSAKVARSKTPCPPLVPRLSKI
jgi:hypothetical protein